jgi:hypothetical protein
MSKEQMVGGWEFHTDQMKPCDLPQKAATAFSKATQGIIGVSYVPVLYVASQLVSGMNYCIVCKTTATTNPPMKSCKTLTIYEDLAGNAKITKIEDIVG